MFVKNIALSHSPPIFHCMLRMLHSPLTDRPVVIIVLLCIVDTFTRCIICIRVDEMIHLTLEVFEDIS